MFVKKGQGGAVWVEFLVASSTVLVSLFILIPILAKHMDIRHKTEQAAQYSSWERSVWHDDARKESVGKKAELDLIGQAKHRVLADGDTLIYSGQSGGSIKVDSFHNFIDSKTGAANYTSLLSARGSGPEQSLAGGLEKENIKEPGSVGMIGALTLSLLNLQTNVGEVTNINGYYQNRASITVKQPSWLPAFTSDDITMNSYKALLVDGWGSGGVGYTRKQVNELQPLAFTFDVKGTSLGSVSPKAGLELYRDIYDNPLLNDILKLTTDIGKDSTGKHKLDFDHVDSDPLLYENNHPNGNHQLSDYYQ